jgi:hypothetical protein
MLDPEIMLALRMWSASAKPRLQSPIHFANNSSIYQFGCICSQIVISIATSTDCVDFQACSCDVGLLANLKQLFFSLSQEQDDVPCPNVSCRDAVLRLQTLYAYSGSVLHWAQSTLGDILLDQSKLAGLFM